MPACRLRAILRGSARRGGRCCVAAETDVETDAHDVRALRDIDECMAQPRHLRRESKLASAEIVVAVLDEARQGVAEGTMLRFSF